MKIAIYGRTNGQNNIEEQVKKCREYAQQNNYEIENEYIDDLETDGRSFEQLIEAAADFDGVIMENQTRLSRNALEREGKMQMLREAGLETLFISNN